MSTRSNVGIKKGDKFKYIYVHFDGYPSGVGQTLKTHYTDPAKVEELISLGSCSTLGADLDPQRAKFDDYSSKVLNPNGSMFYGRDRGEENVAAREVDWEEYVKQLGDDIWVEYVYVFENGEWAGYKNGFDFGVDDESGELKIDEPDWTGLVKVKEEEYADA